MLWKSIIAVALGAALGALLRWQLSVWLNASFPAIPPGTLLSNLIGGYVVGIAIAVFATSTLPVEWRLFVITGFCGGLSTFSAELVTLLQQGRSMWALAAAGVHLAGSIAMTFAGIATVFLARKLAS